MLSDTCKVNNNIKHSWTMEGTCERVWFRYRALRYRRDSAGTSSSTDPERRHILTTSNVTIVWLYGRFAETLSHRYFLALSFAVSTRERFDSRSPRGYRTDVSFIIACSPLRFFGSSRWSSLRFTTSSLLELEVDWSVNWLASAWLCVFIPSSSRVTS